MKKILCLSFWTPPVVRPQSILIGKMIPEWLKQGLEPVIVSYQESGQWNIDVPIHQIPQMKKGRLSRIPFIRKTRQKRYYRKIVNICKNIINEHKIDLVFSFAKPMESNTIGALLKQECGVKFVSHFSDPWYDNPYSSEKNDAVLTEESFIMEQSDKVIFTNSVQQDLMLKKYLNKHYENKSHIIPHCFDSSAYPQLKNNNDKFTISYIGAFYQERNPQILFEALSEVLTSDKDKNTVQLELVGAANDYAGYSNEQISEMVQSYGLSSCVNIIPAVPYEESLKYIKDSDCLVAIDANFKDSPFLPSKLADYAGSGNFILSISPTASPTEEFVRNLGCQSFNYQQKGELVEFLQKAIIDGQMPELDANKTIRYSAKSTTQELINIFQNT